MPVRVSRDNGDGTYEHFDSIEAIKSAEEQESKQFRAIFFALTGFAACGFFCYFALQKYGADFPKWLRIGLWLSASTTAGYVAAKLAEILWALIVLALSSLVLWWLGTLLWKIF